MNATNNEAPPMPFVVDIPIYYHFLNELPNDIHSSEEIDNDLETVDENINNRTTPVVSGEEREKCILPRRNRQKTTRNPKPVTKKTHKKRLITQLRQNVNELAIKTGQEVVAIIAETNKTIVPTFKVFGSEPLQNVIQNMEDTLSQKLRKAMADLPPAADKGLFKLPPLMVDGNLTTLRKMNQAQLRAFIPYMLKFSTGRGKPGWGKDYRMPPWWPKDVPYDNIRTDSRPSSEKRKKPWTTVLRKIITNCYRHHKREDLLKLCTNKKRTKNDPNKTPTRQATVSEPAVYLVGQDGNEYPVVVSRIIQIPVILSDSPPTNSSNEICDSSERDADATHQVLIEGYGKDLPQVLEVASVPINDEGS